MNVDINPANIENTGVDADDPDWAAVIIGSTSQTASVNQSDGIGFLVRGNGGYQVFDGTSGINVNRFSGDLGNMGFDESGFYDIRINYFVPDFDDLSSVDVAIFVDDVLIHSFKTDAGFANNHIVLAGYNSDATILTHALDNFQVWASIPEPGALALLALAAAALARRK